jgi:hypothetical protein
MRRSTTRAAKRSKTASHPAGTRCRIEGSLRAVVSMAATSSRMVASPSKP